MKFHLLYTALLLFVTCHLILCEDWTHSGGDNGDDEEEEEESRERKEAKSFQINGISLPWVKTSRQHLSTIPKSLLVQINLDSLNDHLLGTPFFCRVEVAKGVKIIGKLDYNKTQCIIPGKFPLSSLNEQTVTGKNGLLSVPTSGEWPLFEVLLNPRRLNLNADLVSFRQGKGQSFAFLLPARPVLAQSSAPPPPPPSSSAHRKRHPAPPSYLAFCRFQQSSKIFYHYPGVVVEKEAGQNGAVAFYYGLNSVQSDRVCVLFVVAVLNTRLPPKPAAPL
ncbi:hypothetical protein TYRP_003817 [Tyrophagus putrescentiae]|nr:hypothetical protein TYRP_003817 [Tyrophagus putrescentiae]